MHPTGSSMVSLVRAARCPWDFDWQFIYEPTDSIVISRGDTIRVECTWDRALRDPELEPAYVLWADGTNDEMCFSTIVTRPV